MGVLSRAVPAVPLAQNLIGRMGTSQVPGNVAGGRAARPAKCRRRGKLNCFRQRNLSDCLEGAHDHLSSS